jgi:hypothetical protein
MCCLTTAFQWQHGIKLEVNEYGIDKGLKDTVVAYFRLQKE